MSQRRGLQGAAGRERQRPSARASCVLFIDERPLMPRLRAWAYSWAKVGPWAPRCDRWPPRRDDDMSWVEVRLAEFDSPERARSLFTVRAAISFARPLLSPRLLALASMCLYCRSRLGLDPRGIPDTSWLPNVRSCALTCALLRAHLRERRYPPNHAPRGTSLPPRMERGSVGSGRDVPR